jgi:hypothetical protein
MNNTLSKILIFITAIAALIVFTGCERKDPNHPNLDDSSSSVALDVRSIQSSSSSTASSFTAVTNAEPANFATDAWVGQWDGPEGTFLKIEGDKGVYKITIQNLDGPTEYEGSTLGDRITFNRDDATEIIHATDGNQTGMKWLENKQNCLMVPDGEGYCRD